MANIDRLSPEYRFFTTDLLTNQVISEIPLNGVSYETSLVNAGNCSGSIFIDSESRKYDLYNATMPGKTGLYIMRNGVCVWGGIIWSREYSLEDKTLQISASEFTSYLYHRTIWKTFSNAFSGVLNVSSATATPNVASEVTIANGSPFTVSKGDTVKLVFAAQYSLLNGYFAVANDSRGDLIYVNTSEKSYRLTHKKVTAYKKSKLRATVRLWTQTPHNLKIGDQYVITNSGNALTGNSLDGKHSSVLVVNDAYSFTIKIWGGKKGFKAVDASKVSIANPQCRLTVNGAVPFGTYDVSVYIKNGVYDFVKSLIQSMGNDFTGTEFPNVQIEAGSTFVYDISSYKVNGGVATMTTSTPHELTPSQKITIVSVNPSIDGEHVVREVIDGTTFTFDSGANYIGYAEIAPKQYTLTKRATLRKITTYTTSAAHALSVGDTVVIDNVPDITRQVGDVSRVDVYNGQYVITGVPSTTTFTHSTLIPADDSVNFTTMAKNPNAYVISYPLVQVGTYGPYPQFADIGITFDEADRAFFDVDISTEGVRGFNLTSVGEFLDTFANATDGSSRFEYRIECRYDDTAQRFERVFRFIPVSSGYNYTDAEAGIKYLGADAVVFEYPGNISSFSISENAEDAMTRMFVVGNKEGLDENASQPYSAASSPALRLGWPLLDATEDSSDIDDEGMLSQVAERYIGEAIPPLMDFSISINGSISPVVGSYSPGQWCSIIVDDEFVRMRLESDYEPRNDVLLRRIMSIKVSLSDSSTFAEKVSLDLVPEFEVNGIA